MKRFGGFDESDAIENFIRLKDGFWYKIFHNLLGVRLNVCDVDGTGVLLATQRSGHDVVEILKSDFFSLVRGSCVSQYKKSLLVKPSNNWKTSRAA